MSSPEHKQKIWDLIRKIGVGMLTTEDGNELRARPMQLVQDAYDGTLWFFTDPKAPKVSEIKEDQNVGLTFTDVWKGIYVSLSGNAKVIHDKALIEKYWNEEVAQWYEGGKEDKNCALLEVKVNHGEHWDVASNPLEYYFELGKSKVKGQSPEFEENQKF